MVTISETASWTNMGPSVTDNPYGRFSNTGTTHRVALLEASMYDLRQSVDALRPVSLGAAHGVHVQQVKEIAEVVRAVQFLNRNETETLEAGKRYAYLMEPAARRPVVRLMDESGNVVYQIPPEEVVRRAAELRRKQKARSQDQLVDGFSDDV